MAYIIKPKQYDWHMTEWNRFHSFAKHAEHRTESADFWAASGDAEKAAALYREAEGFMVNAYRVNG